MKNSNDTIGNQTLDLKACSAVPRPIASPRTPIDINLMVIIFMSLHLVKYVRGLEI